MKNLGKSELGLLVLIITYSSIPAVGGLLRVFELASGTAIIPENPRAVDAPVPIVLHILSSALFCLLGALQFLPSIRRHHPVAHRVFGRGLVIAGCVSAATGMWMTHTYAFPEDLQGNLLYWVRIVLGSLMIGFIVCSVIAIRSRNVFRHSAAMLRAYAIGQGASTQAFLGIGWMIAFGTEATGPLRDVLMIAAWGLNFLIAELLIRKLLTPKALPMGAQRFLQQPRNET